jgi:tRNA (cytidine/uridine-2'-O-)-methyltransferase
MYSLMFVIVACFPWTCLKFGKTYPFFVLLTRPMFHIILFQPEIPPNTGNVIRLCANTGSQLHLVSPLGFELDDRQLRRAGLDYHEYAALRVHENLASCLQELPDSRLFAFTTKGSRHYHQASFQRGDALLFGPESRGLPPDILRQLSPEQLLRLPMLPHSRSLNLSNTVAVAVFEAWRQCGFEQAVRILDAGCD